MANYANLKATINANIKANGTEAITGPVLNSVLTAAVNTLGAGYQFMGVATTSTNPGTPDANVFYIAATPGTYTNFGGKTVADGEVAILKYNGSWTKEVTGAATAAQLTQLGQELIVNNDEDVTVQMILGKYINTNVSNGQTVDITPVVNGAYSYIIIPVSSGQKIRVKGQGGGGPRLWALLDSSYKLLSKSASDLQTASYIELTVSENGFCICNATKTSATYPRGVVLVHSSSVSEAILNLSSKTDERFLENDYRLFGLDTQPWTEAKRTIIKTNVSSSILPYLGKLNCSFIISGGGGRNCFMLQAKNKATGNLVTLYTTLATAVSLPLTIPNPRPDLELVELTISGLSNTIQAEVEVTIVKPNPIVPLTDSLPVIEDMEEEIFCLDSQPWKFSRIRRIKPSVETIFLPYLGKGDCEFKIESDTDNVFQLLATNKATGNSVSLFAAQSTPAQFPLTIPNPRPDLELINVRILGYYTTTAGDFSVTITKPNPIAPLLNVQNSKKYISDCPVENYKTSGKYQESDYVAMLTSDTYAAYDSLMQLYPDYISKTELGEVESVAVGSIPAETNKMYRYDFAPAWPSGSSGVPKIKIMILTGTHPEYMAIRSLLKIMTSICNSWQDSAALEFLRFNVHWIIIPIASPWAVNHQSRVNANGVDMARNYPAGWTQGTYIAPPSSTSTYGGESPLCEVEAQLINEVFEAEKEGMIAAIDFHNNYQTDSAFWIPVKDSFMASVAANFLKLMPRQLTKYPVMNLEKCGYLDYELPGGSFGYNALMNGVEGTTFETTQGLVTGLEHLGDVLTVSHDGFINFLLVLCRALLARQYSKEI